MGNSKYLPIGAIVGKQYEILDILGEDDFEILYLARDTHRKESFFVLKELFLETFSSRIDTAISTIPEAEGVLDKRKKEIITELDNPKRNRQVAEIKTYGYVEDNNTIYTIMEFTNNSNLENYLQFTPKEKGVLPSLEKLLNNNIKKKSSLFLKILIAITLTLAGLAYYSYHMLQTDRDKPKEEKVNIVSEKKSIEHPPLTNRNEIRENREEVDKSPKVDKNITNEINETQDDFSDIIEDDKIYMDSEDEDIEEEIYKENKIDDTLLGTRIESNPLSLGTKIETTKESDFTENSVHEFLNLFIASSADNSIDNLLFYYAQNVDRYFNLRDINHMTIREDKERYNKKWTNREFTIENFKILQTYEKENINYCEIETTTKWKVSTKSGKTVSGVSKGFMRLKNTANGFKVISIYTLK